VLPVRMAVRVEVRRVAGLALATVTLAASCGRTTLMSGVEGHMSEGYGGAASVPDGSDASVAGLGGMPDGDSGLAGFSGTAPLAGALTGGAGQDGGQGGEPSTCTLAPGDCRREDEVACVSHQPCRGDVLSAEIYPGSPTPGLRHLTLLAAARDGGVMAAGRFAGTLEFGGDIAPLMASSEGTEQLNRGAAFVASLSADGGVQWAHTIDGAGLELPTALGVTSSGLAVVTLAGDGYYFTHPPALVALDERGARFRYPFGTRPDVYAGALTVGKGDAIWVGGFFEKLDYRDVHLESSMSSGYLLRVDTEGNALEAHVTDAGIANARVIDEQGYLITARVAGRAETGPRGLLEKRTKSGELVFSRRFQVETELTALTHLRLAVDRKGRITLARSFSGTFENEGVTFRAGEDTDIWLAQYEANGELGWQQSFERDGWSSDYRSEVPTLVTDPFDNVLLLGSARRLVVGDQVAEPAHESSGFVYLVKLRPDGSPSFLRWFELRGSLGALTADVNGRIWLGGSAIGPVWSDDGTQDIVNGDGALLLRLSP
jgi:hypothetical protein